MTGATSEWKTDEALTMLPVDFLPSLAVTKAELFCGVFAPTPAKANPIFDLVTAPPTRDIARGGRHVQRCCQARHVSGRYDRAW